MKTKTIFKTLALAMMMPAMLLTTACSSSNDDAIINNENINNENTAKKGFEFPVTVNVTREGDATTRATYNGSTLSFSTGDKLFVKGYNWTTSFDFAGTLTWQSGGTFSGTITTSTAYSGTADDLFSLNDVKVTLLPNGYGTYGFYSIDEKNGYDAEITPNYNNTFASTKALAVEQFSDEYNTDEYDGGFALEPHNAILNFTITGLTASTGVNVVFTKGYLNIDKTVTTNESGTATFAIGVEGYSDLKYCTLTVGGTAITLGSHELVAGHIYNITRSIYPLLSSATTSDYGKVVCNNGHLHPAKTAVTGDCTAVAVFGYISGDNRYAIALQNSGMSTWDAITNNGANKNTNCAVPGAWNVAAPNGASWVVATKEIYSGIFYGLGSTTEENGGYAYNATSNAFITEGINGAALQNNYWSTSEYNNGGWFFSGAWQLATDNSWQTYVRPVLAF